MKTKQITCDVITSTIFEALVFRLYMLVVQAIRIILSRLRLVWNLAKIVSEIPDMCMR